MFRFGVDAHGTASKKDVPINPDHTARQFVRQFDVAQPHTAAVTTDDRVVATCFDIDVVERHILDDSVFPSYPSVIPVLTVANTSVPLDHVSSKLRSRSRKSAQQRG
ncbi:MAG: hypothetical protein ACOC9P_00925 [bacterium]